MDTEQDQGLNVNLRFADSMNLHIVEFIAKKIPVGGAYLLILVRYAM